MAYGSLDSVGHLFHNYRTVREQLEQPYWQQFEQQRQEARERFAREQEWERERETAQRERQRQQRQQKKAQRRKEPGSKREEVKLPRTVEEALSILHLAPPVTASDIKRAYRT